MNIKLHSRILAIFVAVALSFSLASFGTATPAAAPDAGTMLSSLPTSDVVAFVDVRRIMLEIIPRLMANDPATLAKMIATVNEIKTKSGVNILTIESVVAGVRFVGPVTHNMKKENVGVVIIVHGDFDANALIAVLKEMTKGKVDENTYAGKVIYSEPQSDPLKKKPEREIPAVTVLDANTIAVGDLPQIRAAVDAFGGKERVDPALAQAAQRDSSAVIGLAGNVPESLLQDLKKTAPPDPMAQAISNAVAGVKQIFNSIGATSTDYNFVLGARLGSPEQAASVSDMLLGIRTQAAPHLPNDHARKLLDSLQITAEGDVVQIKCEMKIEVAQRMVASMMKEEKATEKAEAKAAVNKPKRKAKYRRGRRRPPR